MAQRFFSNPINERKKKKKERKKGES
jgi:hypothetical protein